jgi:hypothetical protein
MIFCQIIINDLNSFMGGFASDKIHHHVKKQLLKKKGGF